jgi:transposase
MLVVCEATGGYERGVLEICIELGIGCHLAHGKRVRDFANYLGVLAKTDPIDARVIALYGLKTEGLRLYQPPSAETRALKDLQNRRAEILDMLIAEGNRLEHARHPSVAKTLRAHIISLQKLRDALEAEVTALIKSSEVMARKAKLMRSLKGVGPVTVATLLAHMPELGTLSKGEAAALAGLAPINRDSGKAQGARHIVAGRSAIRRTLYMAAVVAMQCNPVVKAFGRGLTERGKPFKVVATAVMRKMLITLNSILKSEKPWRMAKIA